MDFHTLTRRQLQTLCKRNKIPANLTNVAMADALSALPLVEGMDEISPATKSVAAAGVGGASTCRRTATATATTRRRTRQTPAKMMETLDLSGTGQEVGKVYESTEYCYKNLPHHATPAPPPHASAAAPAPASRNTLTRGGGGAQGTRRSTRLAVKNYALVGKSNANVDDDHNRLETVVKKMDFGETQKGQEDSPTYDVDLVSESLRRIDLNEKSGKALLDQSNDDDDDAEAAAAAAAVSVIKSDPSVAANINQNQKFDICYDASNEDGHDEVTEKDDTLGFEEERDSTNDEAAATEEDGRSKEVDDDGASGEKFEVTEIENTFEFAEELDSTKDDVAATEDDHVTVTKGGNDDGDGCSEENFGTGEEELDACSDDSAAFETKYAVYECSLGEEKYGSSEILCASRMNVLLEDGMVESDEFSGFQIVANSEEQQDMVVVSMVTEGTNLEENKLAEKLNDMVLIDLGVGSSSLKSEDAVPGVDDSAVVEIQNKDSEEDLTRNSYGGTADFNGNSANIKYLTSPERKISCVSSPSPRKRNTPPSTNAKRMSMTKVSDKDNKENLISGDNGTKLVMTTSSPAKEKKDGLELQSLRMLRKELRIHLEKANSKDHHLKASTRPALQPLSGNR